MNNQNSSSLPLLALALLGCGASAQAQNSPQIAIANADQVATDGLGRTLPTYAEVGAPKPNRWVGMFYWQWHGPGNDRFMPGQYDLSKYLQSRPYFKDFSAHPPGGPDHPVFYWAEPLFGYYRSTDAWVMRKHLVMLADAGVDFLFLDYTNAQVYDAELKALLDVARDLKAGGTQVPRLVFFLNHEPDWKIEHLYKNWFQPGQYDDLWFQWRGKPLMMAPQPANDAKFKDPSLIAEAQKYFSWRPTWAFHDAAKEPTKWRFLHGFNAPVALDPEGQPEQIIVNKSTGGPLWDNLKEGGVSAVEGKTYQEKDYAPNWTLPDASRGVFFQDAWNRALQIAPPIVLVTGWNEWNAAVWDTPGVVMLGRKTVAGQGHIVDQFNSQFNRDIEPMRGGHGDNYYLQFIANMRRYKGMEAPQAASAPRRIKIDGRFGDWASVGPEFRDTARDIANRDSEALVPNIRYVDKSARNDIVASKVVADKSSLFFHARTASTLSPRGGANWMLLFIDADQNARTGWNGYDFVVNRGGVGEKATTISANIGGRYEWGQPRRIPLRAAGRELELAIPRRVLGLRQGAARLSFKWADNIPARPDILDFYSSGDVAPNSRFSYRASLTNAAR